MKKKAWILFFAAATALSLLSGGCSSGEVREDAPLRIAVLPILDTLPFYVAEQNGYFEDAGVQVELVPVKSPTERDALVQAGEVEGMLTDLQGVAVFNRDEPHVKVIAKARKAYPEAPLFRLLGAPGSGLDTPEEVAGVKIGVSQNTVIEYITERMLERSGVPASQIVVEEVTAIPVRFEQLMSGQLKAATLPDPMAQGAIAGGAELILADSTIAELSQSVLVFDVDVIQSRPAALQNFLVAWYQAVTELNENPGAYTSLLIEQGRVPESIQETYAMPPFPVNEITSPEQWQDVVAWMLDKDLISREIPYQEAVDTAFLD